MSTNVIFLDGESPYWDRGFLYAESIYDVIPFYNNKPYGLLEHFNRFQRDLLLMKIDFSLNFDEFSAAVSKVVAKAEYNDGAIYVQVTSGNVGYRSAMPDFASASNMIIYAFEYNRPQMAQLSAGIKLVLFPDNRGSYCYVKSTNRLPNRLAMLYAKERGALESLWHDAKEGLIHEACTGNIFFIHGDDLITPSLSTHIFPGIVRERILEIAEELEIRAVTRNVNVDELKYFQAAFITGSVKQLVPVRQIDHVNYNIHPLWNNLFKAYNDRINASCYE